MMLVLFCSYNKLMYNVLLIGFSVCTYAAHLGHQARKKPLVTANLPVLSYARGWRSEYNYDRIPLIGQITLAPYSIANNNLIVPCGDRQWLPYLTLLCNLAETFCIKLCYYLLYGRLLIVYGRFSWTAFFVKSSEQFVNWFALLPIGQTLITVNSRIGKPTSRSQANLWPAGWRLNPPESKKSAQFVLTFFAYNDFFARNCILFEIQVLPTP